MAPSSGPLLAVRFCGREGGASERRREVIVDEPAYGSGYEVGGRIRLPLKKRPYREGEMRGGEAAIVNVPNRRLRYTNRGACRLQRKPTPFKRL